MSGLASFINMFLSYLLVVVVAAAVVAVAIFIGITVRKAKNKKEAAIDAEGSKAEN